MPLSQEILDGQQDTADRLFRLGLVPSQVTIRDAVWKGAGTQRRGDARFGTTLLQDRGDGQNTRPCSNWVVVPFR